MNYTTEGREYTALCDLACERDCELKLVRHGSMWGIHIVEPQQGDSDYRAAAVLFPRLELLDEEAGHLLRWLTSAGPTDKEGSGT